VHLLTGSDRHVIDLGIDGDADRLYLYRPDTTQAASTVLNFKPGRDTLTLVNLDATDSASFSISADLTQVLINDIPLLTLAGSFSLDSLQAGLRRSDLGAGDAMAAIAERGLLITEVIPGLRGSSEQQTNGEWYGYNVDIARAISEQLTGSADRLAIRPTTSLLKGLEDVRTGLADLSLLGSTSTISQDVSLGLDFSRPYLVDMQGLLVKGLSDASQLVGATIGVLNGSTARVNTLRFLASQGITASVSEYANTDALVQALNDGQITAIASDYTRLIGYQARVTGSTLLKETFSAQPLAVALPQNQSNLKDAVNWIVQTPAAAEELGISASDLPKLIEQAERGGADLAAINPQSRIFLELGPTNPSTSLGKAIGLASGFTQKVLARLGNASELWRRHFQDYPNTEKNSATEGGLLRSLPFLGAGKAPAPQNNDSRGDLLEIVRQRGTLNVATGGTSSDMGFSAPDADGTLQGVDADLARALAIAIFDDPSKVAFNTSFSGIQPTLEGVANGTVDVILRATTANLYRDGGFGVDFSDSYLQIGLRILTRTSLGVKRIDQLNGSSIGVIAGTTAAQSIRLALAKTGGAARIVSYDNDSQLYQAFETGLVEAIAEDGALLAAFQNQLLGQDNRFPTTLLSSTLSYEPLTAVVDENQSHFLDLINALIAILQKAAELDVNSDNVNERFTLALANEGQTELRSLFQLDPGAVLPTSLGLTPERIKAILAYGGNIDEITSRSVFAFEQNTVPLAQRLIRPI
jgi:general L-amino acid transport system substrate-binding protein